MVRSSDPGCLGNQKRSPERSLAVRRRHRAAAANEPSLPACRSVHSFGSGACGGRVHVVLLAAAAGARRAARQCPFFGAKAHRNEIMVLPETHNKLKQTEGDVYRRLAGAVCRGVLPQFLSHRRPEVFPTFNMSMWKAAVGTNVQMQAQAGDDDWETDPDFVVRADWADRNLDNDSPLSVFITACYLIHSDAKSAVEKLEGNVVPLCSIGELREQVAKDDAAYKKRVLEELPKASYGYGGKFGVQNDRMDKSAVGNDYMTSLHKHASQTDAVKGFGGKFGVQSDRQDKCAVGWEHHESVEKHASQKDYSSGFGGKFGVQKERQDKSAVGWEFHEKTQKHASQTDSSALGWNHVEKVEKHESQKDYAKGFGGKFGVQTDRQDSSALSWSHIEKVEKHESQKDYAKGFGGKFGIEKDKQDKSAYSFSEVEKPKPAYQKPKPEIEVSSERAKSLRSRFENMAKAGEEEARKLADEEKQRRLHKDRLEKEAAKKAEEERQKKLRDEHKRIDELQEQLKATEGRDGEEGEDREESYAERKGPLQQRRQPAGRIRAHPARVQEGPLAGLRHSAGTGQCPPSRSALSGGAASPDVSPTQETKPQEERPPAPVVSAMPAAVVASAGVAAAAAAAQAAASHEPEPAPAPVAEEAPKKKVVPQIHHSPVESESSPESGPGWSPLHFPQSWESLEEGIYEQLEPARTEKTISAVALYDYQAAEVIERHMAAASEAPPSYMTLDQRLPAPNQQQPHVVILEQPASRALRFRYQCEGRYPGTLVGVSSTAENKTYPTIKVMNVQKPAVVVVSCVTKDQPYRVHPHNLVGKEGCKNGICTQHLKPDMTCTFTSLGIQCVKRRDVEQNLVQRETIRVDPFRNGFGHKDQAASIDLNAVRLCFQVFLEGSQPGKFTIPLHPVVSDIIYDRKAMSDLTITKLSHTCAPMSGGLEMILLCDKVAKDDIEVWFEEEREGQTLWKERAELLPNGVHKQVAICFRTPRYREPLAADLPVDVHLQLRRPSDGALSEPRAFTLHPNERGETLSLSLSLSLSSLSLSLSPLSPLSSLSPLSPPLSTLSSLSLSLSLSLSPLSPPLLSSLSSLSLSLSLSLPPSLPPSSFPLGSCRDYTFLVSCADPEAIERKKRKIGEGYFDRYFQEGILLGAAAVPVMSVPRTMRQAVRTQARPETGGRSPIPEAIAAATAMQQHAMAQQVGTAAMAQLTPLNPAQYRGDVVETAEKLDSLDLGIDPNDIALSSGDLNMNISDLAGAPNLSLVNLSASLFDSGNNIGGDSNLGMEDGRGGGGGLLNDLGGGGNNGRAFKTEPS
ncbi:hypothetical protein HPB48_018197 [Haemaphysalis longicornis]|uniref:RHD domain-containing protein n=1 Tax=Haemaphysalis longicornis TaxID=44386 RepID=A0A9J6GYF6_HAELO|nr:hypothetical protein HPB48_018197 [Haemaphysalis longicornis]